VNRQVGTAEFLIITKPEAEDLDNHRVDYKACYKRVNDCKQAAGQLCHEAYAAQAAKFRITEDACRDPAPGADDAV